MIAIGVKVKAVCGVKGEIVNVVRYDNDGNGCFTVRFSDFHNSRFYYDLKTKKNLSLYASHQIVWALDEKFCK